MPADNPTPPVQRVTDGPMHHFVGYYDKCCWNGSGRYILAHEASFRDRNPTGDDPLTLGVIDLEAGNAFKPMSETRAWNWQQACMSRWLPPREEHTFIYNDIVGEHYGAIEFDMQTGATRALPWPIYDLSRDGRHATSMNFERITFTRPGYGYFSQMPDPFGDKCHPDGDGLYIIDLQQPKRDMIFSLAEAATIGGVRPPADQKAWFNCMKFNPSATRILFLHRWASRAIAGHAGFVTRMLTINPDGSNPAVILEGLKISHFDWYDDTHILVWLESPERGIHNYCMVADPAGELRKVGEGHFDRDGHCNLSPDRRWMVTDTYPQGPRHEQPLMLYDMKRNRRIDLGAFPALEVPDDSMRCDLHTRWNRDGTQLCFDSTHEGSRQVYTVDISHIVRADGPGHQSA